MKVHNLVQNLKESGQDFEFYPTTSEMLSVIERDMREHFNVRDDETVYNSVLDVGCGSGSALHALTKGDKFGIEKSQPLIDQLDSSIFIVGTDFHSQTLIDKPCDVVFCNPPYSSWDSFATRIIKEANSGLVYLVIPQRWENSDEMKRVIELRSAKTKILWKGDFLDAPRKARAKVHVVRVQLCGDRYYRSQRSEPASDPFSLWFDENFPLDIAKSEVSGWVKTEAEKAELEKQEEDSRALIKEQGLVHVLDTWYQNDLAKLMTTYKSLTDIDPDILKELDVNIAGVKKALRQKVAGTKDKYWRKLFDSLDTITSKLCSSSRQALLDTLMSRTHVDYSVSNALAIVIWAIKNANNYFDTQLIDIVEKMTELANVTEYKSNQKTFKEEKWRYASRWDVRKNLERYSFKLDYRIVVTGTGGIDNADWGRRDNGLSESSTHLIDDLLTIGRNLNFDTDGTIRAANRNWQPNDPQVFTYFNHTLGEHVEFMKVRAFKNGNLWINFNQDFLCQLNVEFGRLKGWISTANEASAELDISYEKAQAYFNSNLQLNAAKPLLLLAA